MLRLPVFFSVVRFPMDHAERPRQAECIDRSRMLIRQIEFWLRGEARQAGAHAERFEDAAIIKPLESTYERIAMPLGEWNSAVRTDPVVHMQIEDQIVL